MVARQEDPRSLEELIAAAILESEQDEEEELETGRSAIVALHARGTRDVLEAGLALCASPDPRDENWGR